MISFGAKIPIAKCKIQNRKTGKFENATVYEYTCADKSDVEKIKRITSKQDWEFGFDILNDASWKNFVFETDKSWHNNHFYSIENNRRKTIGLCETVERDSIAVELLETQKDKLYRFVGQTMLAALANKAFSGFNSLIIPNALPKALDFYKKTCGFKRKFNNDDEVVFFVDKPQLQDFIKQTEQRTNGAIISLSV